MSDCCWFAIVWISYALHWQPESANSPFGNRTSVRAMIVCSGSWHDTRAQLVCGPGMDIILAPLWGSRSGGGVIFCDWSQKT